MRVSRAIGLFLATSAPIIGTVAWGVNQDITSYQEKQALKRFSAELPHRPAGMSADKYRGEAFMALAKSHAERVKATANFSEVRDAFNRASEVRADISGLPKEKAERIAWKSFKDFLAQQTAELVKQAPELAKKVKK